MIKNNTLALFDFDGTITTEDTFLKFIRFTHGSFRYWLGIWLLSPMLLLYFLKLIRNDRAKVMMFKYYFGRWNYDRFYKAGEDFCNQLLPSMIRKNALDKIKFHQENNHRVILITASGKEWVEPWCKKIGIEIISTEIEIKNNRVTGNLSTPNCFGPEKVNRLKSLLSLEDYGLIYAYGDSEGDREMLALSQQPEYKPFRL